MREAATRLNSADVALAVVYALPEALRTSEYDGFYPYNVRQALGASTPGL